MIPLDRMLLSGLMLLLVQTAHAVEGQKVFTQGAPSRGRRLAWPAMVPMAWAWLRPGFHALPGCQRAIWASSCTTFAAAPAPAL